MSSEDLTLAYSSEARWTSEITNRNRCSPPHGLGDSYIRQASQNTLMTSNALVIGSPLTFNRAIVWVCKNFDCPDTSKYQNGQKCSGCREGVGCLPAAFLGRWLVFKRSLGNPTN